METINSYNDYIKEFYKKNGCPKKTRTKMASHKDPNVSVLHYHGDVCQYFSASPE